MSIVSLVSSGNISLLDQLLIKAINTSLVVFHVLLSFENLTGEFLLDVSLSVCVCL